MHDDEIKRNNRIKIGLLILIGIMSIMVRVLSNYDFDGTSLLYVATPYLIALGLLFIYRPANNTSWKRRYLNLSMMSLVVMLGSSIVLFEGFLCVLMFMPIYFFFVFLAFIAEWIRQRNKESKGTKLYSNAIPLLVLISAFEGVTPETSFNRHYSVTREGVVESNIEAIKSHLAKPMVMQNSEHWFLSLFPMPYHIEAGSLNQGDIHQIDLRYHRWFVTNTHEGRMELQISNVEENLIETRFLSDSSYLSNYMNLKSTRIELKPLTANKTKVLLTVQYERLLDPVWYFGPMQEYAVGLGAELLLEQVINPNNSNQAMKAEI